MSCAREVSHLRFGKGFNKSSSVFNSNFVFYDNSLFFHHSFIENVSRKKESVREDVSLFRVMFIGDYWKTIKTLYCRPA